MHADPAAVKKSIRTYLKVFGALLVLTVITVAVAELQVGLAMGVTIALLVAAVKASLVAAVFMHLADEKRWIYGSLLLTAVFFLVLMLLPVLTTLDTTSDEPSMIIQVADPHAGH
jgi:cytochrome c oxidase subunit IV